MEIISTPETYAFISERVSDHVDVFIDGSFNNNLKEIKTPTHPAGFGWSIRGNNDRLDGFGVSGLMSEPTKSPERYELKGINQFLKTVLESYLRLADGKTSFTIYSDNANLVRFLSPEVMNGDFPANDNPGYANNLASVLKEDLTIFEEYRLRLPIILRWAKGHRADNVFNQIADGFAKRCYRSMVNGIHFKGKVRHSAMRSVLYNNEMALDGLDFADEEEANTKITDYRFDNPAAKGKHQRTKDRALRTGGKMHVALNVRERDTGQTVAVMSHQCSEGFKHTVEVYDYPVKRIALEFQAIISALNSYRISPQFKHSVGITLVSDLEEVSAIVNTILAGHEPPIISDEGEDLTMWNKALRTASEGMLVRCHVPEPLELLGRIHKISRAHLNDIFDDDDVSEMLSEVS